jgi:aminopeptidase YwaD
MESRPPHDPDTQELLNRARRRSTRRSRLRVLEIAVVAVLAAGGLTAAAVAGLHARASTSPTVTQAAGPAGPTQAAVQTLTPQSSSTTRPLPPTTAPAAKTNTTTPSTTKSSATASTTPTSAGPALPLTFDATRAMAHVKQLAVGMGVRTGGTESEAAAARYAADYLKGLGYSVDIVPVALPNGRVSHNVKAVKAGASSATVLLGAHLDSEAPSPGANDNASGVATILELARDLREADTVATIELVLFGTEEIIDTERDHDHYGSRSFVKTMTSAERDTLAAMISVDMVASGGTLTVGTMGRGPQGLCTLLQAHARALGLPVQYDEDTSSYGQGDYEPFELAGFPAAWVEWGDDPTYHTAGDTYQHCDPAVLGKTGEMLLGFVIGLSSAELEVLRTAGP